MVQKITTVLVDDDEMVREGIQLLLEREGISVLAQAANGREALTLVKQHQPQIALLDIFLPLVNGIELAGRIRKDYPKTSPIMLSAHRDHDSVVRSLKAGAKGYVWKGGSFSELALAIRAVSLGQSFISPVVSDGIIKQFLKDGSIAPHCGEVLTARQRQVLQLIAEGQSNKEIAVSFNLSVKAVEKHRSELMRRLDLHNTAQVVMFAIKSGMVKVA